MAESASGEVDFIDDVAAYLKDKDADACLKQLQQQHSNFSMQEVRSCGTAASGRLPEPPPSRGCCSNARGCRPSCLR